MATKPSTRGHAVPKQPTRKLTPEQRINEALSAINEGSRVDRIAKRYSCDTDTAQRYDDLLSEGYPRQQALLMAGLADPAGD